MFDEDLTNEDLIKHLQKEGEYFHLQDFMGRGLCGVRTQLFSVALIIGIEQWSYFGRYCYPDFLQAVVAIKTWDGEGDPPGNWIVYKGIGGERRNPGRNKVDPPAPIN